VRRRLLLMRHAKSSWKSQAATDHERPLNGRGRRAAPRMAAMLAERDWAPRAVLSSDACRTVQTWGRMEPLLPALQCLVWSPMLYFGDLDGIITAADAVPPDLDSLLMLGHNPTWEQLACWLCGEQLIMKTANIAVLEGQGGSWSRALGSHGSWRLVDLLRPR